MVGIGAEGSVGGALRGGAGGSGGAATTGAGGTTRVGGAASGGGGVTTGADAGPWAVLATGAARRAAEATFTAGRGAAVVSAGGA